MQPRFRRCQWQKRQDRAAAVNARCAAMMRDVLHQHSHRLTTQSHEGGSREATLLRGAACGQGLAHVQHRACHALFLQESQLELCPSRASWCVESSVCSAAVSCCALHRAFFVRKEATQCGHCKQRPALLKPASPMPHHQVAVGGFPVEALRWLNLASAQAGRGCELASSRNASPTPPSQASLHG